MAARIALIAAVARNNVIGRDNRLPWRLPEDLKFFKRTTLGKPLVLGRRTWESFGSKPLPGRPHIVLTGDRGYRAEGALVCHTLGEALTAADGLAGRAGVDEVMVIGGGRLFAEALPLAHRLYLTEVNAEPAGDAYFPPFDRGDWAETELMAGDAAGPDSPAFRILCLDRR